MLHLLRTLRVRTVVWLAVLIGVPALPGTAMAQDSAIAAGLSPRLLADASWHGRPIQRPLPARSNTTDRPLRLRRAAGYARDGGSRRVRDLQRRLNRLGYRPGHSDGLFGPRTQAAVLAFQRKHGLPRSGAAGPATLRTLRRRTAPDATRKPAQPTSRPDTQAPPPAAPPHTRARSTDEVAPPGALVIAAVVLMALAAVSAIGRRRRRPVQDTPPASPPPAAPPLPEPPGPEPPPPPRITRARPPRHHGPPDARRAALRERILTMRADGMTLQEIADALTAVGEPTLGGGRHWQPWSVRAALRPFNPGRPRPHARRGSG